MNDLQTGVGSKTGIVEQAKACLRTGHYSRALDLLRSSAGEFSNDSERSELEKRAQEGIERSAEAQRLITESQELFAGQKPGEAIQLLRQAHELDKKNSLARAILANSLVEHAQSLVESDWLEAEKLTNQALAVNPSHPTAKTILHLIVGKKETSSTDDWVSQASKLQSSGDLFGALAWVAEGLAVHPNESRLLQIQEAIQRDQAARRRQTRRNDMDDLRRMEAEIKAATDPAAKRALAERIQGVVARYWTDGEILSIANALLLRLGLLGTAAASHKGAPIIFHVPRPGASKAPGAEAGQSDSRQGIQAAAPASRVPDDRIPDDDILELEPQEKQVPQNKTLQSPAVTNHSKEQPAAGISDPVPPGSIEPGTIEPVEIQPSKAEARKVEAHVARGDVARGKAQTNSRAREKSLPIEVVHLPPPAAAVSVSGAGPLPGLLTASRLQPEPPVNSKIVIAVCAAAATILVGATFFLTRKHYSVPLPGQTTAASNASAPTVAEPVDSAPALPAPVSAPTPTAPEQTSPAASNTGIENSAPPAAVVSDQPAPKPSTTKGDIQRSFQTPVRTHKEEPAKLVSNPLPDSRPDPRPRLASLTIQGGIPGTAVLVDQTVVGSVPADGALSLSTVSPGDHTVELRKERFKPRLFKEHFVAGGAISLVAADASLEAAPAELKISFAPADANVALVKGDFLAMVHSGVPLNLPAGTYTLTTRTADRFTRSSTLEVVAGQSKTLDLALAPNGMSKWADQGAWKPEKDFFIRKGGDYVLYGVAPSAGTFVFSAMPAKGRSLQWVVNYTDARNYVLFQMDDDNFRRTVVRNGEKRDEIIVADKSDKKSFRALRIHISASEIAHQIKHGNSWTVLDRWTQPGADLSLGKFGFYIPGNDEVEVSGFAHYADLPSY